MTSAGVTWMMVRRRKRIHRHEVDRLADKLRQVAGEMKRLRREQTRFTPTVAIDRFGAALGLRLSF